jgi:hypothetical protein
MVGGMLDSEREELAQGGEGNQGEEKNDPAAAGEEGDREHRHHPPPRSDAGVQILDHRIVAIGAQSGAKVLADQGGEDQDTRHTTKK